ncbi:SelT/SelW/SelH family protein [Halovivax gelatinilyticus]|uniref:SelT/SelW/SelH family protein n=1 Tax=Halovivax gelatinilyticus TaxID=2961597 RepID=UPI0020CA2D38|nr:Rdx family protein [Halovivax gelatinilyticus]
MATVEIQYCVPCGHLERAQSLQESLLTEFGQELDAVSLVTGDAGVFTVRADDELLFDKSEDEYDVEEIVDGVGERL